MSDAEPDLSDAVTVDDIRAARTAMASMVRDTPMEGARWLEAGAGGSVFLKCENLQRAGSFKIRGAYNRISRLSDEERSRGVVAASAGNHAQGVALAATTLGCATTVFMPVGAPLPKIAATRGYGAEIRFHGHSVDEALVAAQAFSAETGAVLIHPFNHPHVVAGQGTVGLEILEQVPDVRTVVVCTGGGGLLAGIAVAIKSLRPEVRIVGVQATGAAAYPPSLRVGHPVSLESMTTMADGLKVGRPGDLPFALVQRYVDEIRTVDEEALSRALLLCLERAKLVVEPAGAASLASLLDLPAGGDPALPTPIVAVLSGGNVDPLLLLRIIRHGLASAGRYLSLRLRIPDRPGALAKLLTEVGDAEANVLEVEHVRIDPRLRVDEVGVALQLETRGQAHCDEVVQRLLEHGYELLPL